MKITKEWLKEKCACSRSLNHAVDNNWIGLDINQSIDLLIWSGRLSDANWLITRYMNKIQRVKYAIFAAEQVLYIFEEKYPEDKRPRLAIEAAKAYINNPCKKTTAVVAYAAAAAYADAAAAAYADAAACAADAAADAAYAAAVAAACAVAADAAAAAAYADAAYAAAVAADAVAAYADAVAAYAAAVAADAVAVAADAVAARRRMKIRIIRNGLEIIK